MEKPAEQLQEKRVRVSPGQWDRLQETAQGTSLTANQLMVELAIEALDRREWPATEAEIRMYRANLFTAQVLARELIETGQEGKSSRKSAGTSRRWRRNSRTNRTSRTVPIPKLRPLRAKGSRHVARMTPGWGTVA